MVTFALLASPLLGPAVWAPVSAVLRGRGVDVRDVPAMPRAPRSPSDVLGHFLTSLPTAGSLVLVPHSNAGLFVPRLAMARPVVGYVFVDALLPPASGEVPVAEEPFLGSLTALADADGILPPWTQWWSAEDVTGLYPNDDDRERVEGEAHRLPLSFFRSSLEVPAGWDERPGGYLAFGDTYREELAAAARRGWPTGRLEGQHLHQLHAPAVVAEEILRLAGAAGVGPD
ncbi:hypothetical protein MF406_13965 [Georgenia sp. TF02-10]|uniref:hypothetical protein n=1 Tax=Georgenia sp. TF02-10 TaxID=2917725 RepID=UPI001FA709BF|nr:hypothetical protein [Georgenia sp. TF02-10]UNX54041.1 hypothetical protein MF406_13965 [Georgenia sp. TF02-10]